MVSKIPKILKRLLTIDSKDRNTRESTEVQLNERHAVQMHQNVNFMSFNFTDNRHATDRRITNVYTLSHFKVFVMLLAAICFIQHIIDISNNMKDKDHRLEI